LTERKGSIVPGAILIGLGLVFLLPQLGLDGLGWDNFWPLIIILTGLAFLLGWAAGPDRQPGLAFVGTGALLIGVFLGAFAWNILKWHEMARWWPGFPLIGGLAFLVLWAAGGAKEAGLLVPSLGGIGTGLIAFAVTWNLLDWWLISRWWPLLLILTGVGVLLRQFIGRRD